MIGAVVAALLLAFPPQAPPQNPPPPAAQAPPAGQAQPPPATPPDPAQAKPPQPATPPKPWATFCCFEKGRAEKDGLVTVVYELSHVPSPPNPLNPPQHTQGLEEFQKMLLPYLTPGKGRIELSNRLNSFAVTDTKENIAYVEKMLQLIHKADAPILIEARVVELRWDKNLQIGIEGNLGGTAGFWAQNASSGSFL